MPLPDPQLIETFRPLLDAAQGIDLGDAAQAESVLTGRLDPNGPAAAGLRERLLALLEEGAIANRGEPPVRYGRVAKPGAATGEMSIDVVDMTAPGPRHRHPNGEIDFCVPLEGTPTFDGRQPGWVVYGPGSEHIPTVRGGRMLVVYLLPGGAIEFDPAPSR